MLSPFQAIVAAAAAVERFGEPARRPGDPPRRDGNPLDVAALFERSRDGAYQTGEGRLRSLLERGMYERLDEGYVLYEIERPDGRLFTAFVGRVRADDPRLHPHERVMPSVIAERRSDLERAGGIVEPVVLGARLPVPSIGAGQETIRKVELGDEIHRIGLVPRSSTEGLDTLREAVVLDGHHRLHAVTEHAAAVGATPWVLAAIVDIADGGIAVEPQHRVLDVDDLEGFFAAVERVGMHGDVGRPLASGELRIVTSNGIVTIERDGDDAASRIGSIALERLLPELRGVEVGGYVTREVLAREALRHGAEAVAIVGPVAIEDVVELASEGHLLPEKSTCFNPKVAVGLVNDIL